MNSEEGKEGKSGGEKTDGGRSDSEKEISDVWKEGGRKKR